MAKREIKDITNIHKNSRIESHCDVKRNVIEKRTVSDNLSHRELQRLINQEKYIDRKGNRIMKYQNQDRDIEDFIGSIYLLKKGKLPFFGIFLLAQMIFVLKAIKLKEGMI